jgi:hypothetical protein
LCKVEPQVLLRDVKLGAIWTTILHVLTEVTAEATREDRLGFLGREFESKRN